MEARLEALFKKEEEYTVLEKFQGKKLEGQKYKPLFPYFSHVSFCDFKLIYELIVCVCVCVCCLLYTSRCV